MSPLDQFDVQTLAPSTPDGSLDGRSSKQQAAMRLDVQDRKTASLSLMTLPPPSRTGIIS